MSIEFARPREFNAYWPTRLLNFSLEKFDKRATLLDREFEKSDQIAFSTADGLRFPSMGSKSCT